MIASGSSSRAASVARDGAARAHRNGRALRVREFAARAHAHAGAERQREARERFARRMLRELRERQAEQFVATALLQCIEIRAELELCAAIGRDQRTARAERDEAGEQRIDEFVVRVKAHAQRVRALIREQMVFDQLRGHLHERERMRAEAARIAAHVERAEEAAERIDDRRARAGEHVIRAQEMLGAVHGERLARDQRGADRIRAPRVFRP